MATNAAINRWGIKKYKLAEGSVVEIEQEKRYGGYCETCQYDYEVMVVYATQPGHPRHQIDSYESDLASILNEVLEGVD